MDRPFFVADEGGVLVGRPVPSNDVEVAKAYELVRPDDDGAWARAAAALADALPVAKRRVNPMIVDGWRDEIAKTASAPAGDVAILCSVPDGVEYDGAALLDELLKTSHPWIVSLEKSAGRPGVGWHWAIDGLPGRVFVSSFEPPRDARFVSVTGPAGTARVDKVTKRERRIRMLRKADDLGEQRLVWGIVLEPETVDSQGDIYSADEIARAAHLWMEQFQNTGYMHERLVNEGVRPVESYCAPCDFDLNGQQVKAGTWILCVHVLSDPLWAQVKAGELTGFSIGGYAQRVPAQQVDGQPTG